MADLDPEILENYRSLASSTGESEASVAGRVDTVDPETAAGLRAAGFGKGNPEKRAEAPKGRRSAAPKDEA